MFHFASQHPIIVAVGLLIALAIIVRFAYPSIQRFRQMPSEDWDFDPVVRLAGSHKTADPLAFWRDEIRGIAERYGSPVKAAIQIERSISALDLKALEDGQLEGLHEYWMEISDWCGKVRIQSHRLDPERRWSPSAWTRLFNVFGRVNLRVHIAWSERSHTHSHRKGDEV